MTDPAAQPENASLRARLASLQEGFWALAELASEPMAGPLPDHVQSAAQPARSLTGISGALGLVSLILLCLSGRLWIAATLGLVSVLGGVLGFILVRAIRATIPTNLWHPLNPTGPHLSPRPTAVLSWGDEGLYYVERPGRYFGLPVGTRMAILKPEGSDDLLVYAPEDLPIPLVRAIQRLGTIRWVVFPTERQAESPPDWLANFEDTERWCPGRWSSDASPGWPAGFVEAQVLSGAPGSDELVMYHPASGTLLVKAAILNLGHDPETSLLDQGSLQLLAMARRPGPDLPRKWRMRHCPSLSGEVTRVSSWTFERIFLAHGHLIDHQGKRVWNEAYAFMNPTEPRSQDAA